MLLLLLNSIIIAMESPPSSRRPRLNKTERKQQRIRQHDTLLAFTHSNIDQNKDLNVPIKEGYFAGKTIVTASSTHRVFKDILALALSKGASATMQDGNKHTPLKSAVSAHCRTAFKCLIEHGAIAKDQGLIQEICGVWHDTLDKSQAAKRIKMLEILLDNGASANELDADGNISLYHLLWKWVPVGAHSNIKILNKEQEEIFYNQRKAMIQKLLKSGLNPALENKEKNTAVANIKAHPHLEDIHLLEFLKTESKKHFAVKP